MAVPQNFPRFRMALARRANPKEMLLRWAIMPTDFDLSDIRYEIFKSQGANGPWDYAATAEEGAYQYWDRDVATPGNLQQFYYIIRAASISGKGYRDSDVIYIAHDADHIAKEMMRKKQVFLRAKSGVKLAILSAKGWGAKCSRCWDEVKKLPTDPDCPDCYGVGISGGYCRPFFIWGLLQLPREMVIRAGVPYIEGTNYCEIGAAPHVVTDDIVVDVVANFCHVVKSVQPFAHRGRLVSQILTLASCDENDVVYTIRVAEDHASRRGESFAP